MLKTLHAIAPVENHHPLQRYVYVLGKTAALKSAESLYNMGWVRKDWGQTVVPYGTKAPNPKSLLGRRDTHLPYL